MMVLPAQPPSPDMCPSQAGPAALQVTLTVVGAVVSVADTEVAPTILHAVPTIWALRVHVAWCGGDFCKHMASASLCQLVARHSAAAWPETGVS